MKMLETAWALKHGGLVESPNEGREHLEKIFQLKLSLPSKAFIPVKGIYPDEGEIVGGGGPDANELIKPSRITFRIKKFHCQCLST